MDIQAIDKALDGAIAFLMYGSSAWLACALPVFVATRSKESVQKVLKQDVFEPDVLKQDVPLAEATVEPPKESEAKKSKALPCTAYFPAPPEISCEPVNWKKWKVGDLRKANIVRACGVRISPIGSSRKLLKADLIAQYEQNLRRMTSENLELTSLNEKLELTSLNEKIA